MLIKGSDIPKKIGGVLPHVSETDIFNTKGKVKFILQLIEEEI